MYIYRKLIARVCFNKIIAISIIITTLVGFTGCSEDRETLINDSCRYKVGDTVLITIYEESSLKEEMTFIYPMPCGVDNDGIFKVYSKQAPEPVWECDSPNLCIVTIDSIPLNIGDVLVIEITEVKSSSSYVAELIEVR